MDFSCESLLSYQYMPHQELSAHVIKEFEYLHNILDKGKRSVLAKSETVQRIYCLACVLWQSQETSCDLTTVLKDEIYDILLSWTLNTPPSAEYALLKVAVDRVLCSMCSIKPDLYDRLLTKLNILPKNPGCENECVYNFCHIIPDSEGEDTIHPSVPVDLKSINLNENMLKSLSVISLSCIPTYKLIHTKFLSILIDLVIDFIVKDTSMNTVAATTRTVVGSPTVNLTNFGPLLWPGGDITDAINLSTTPIINYSTHNSSLHLGEPNDNVSQTDQSNFIDNGDTKTESFKINIDLVSAVLDFFAELCWQNVLRMWLSSERNTVLWEYLLRYLCFEVPKSQKGFKYLLPSKPNTKLIKKLEESTINFFTKCFCGHFKNQEKFAQVFYNVLCGAVGPGTEPPGLSDFTRRILFEFITSPGHIYVSIETDLPEGVNKIKTADISLLLPPPAFPTSKRHQLLYLNVDRSCADIFKKVKINSDENTDEVRGDDLNNKSQLDMSWVNCLPSTSKQCDTVEGSFSSTNKRFRETTGIPQPKKTRISESSEQNSGQLHKLMLWAPNMYQFVNVNQYWTIAEILQIFVPSGDELEVPVLKFLLSKQEEVNTDAETSENNLSPPLALQKFVSLEGFQHIALNVEKKPAPVPLNKRYHTGLKSSKKGRVCALNQIPIHTLLAFGQFLRLPEYRTNSETKSVLQSIIGIGKETNLSSEKYSRFFIQDVAKMCNPVLVLPFELLRLTISGSYKNSADISDLDVKYISAIDFVLIYLAVYTHQPENKDFNAIQENKVYIKALRQCYWSKSENKSKSTKQSYWPKGIGYSSNSHSDYSKALAAYSRIEEEEDLITALLLILGSYIGPHRYLHVHSSSFKDHIEDICKMRLMCPLPPIVVEQIRKSCLCPVIISYLKNDSVLDIVKHIPLYKAIMLVLRTMVSNKQLADILLLDASNNGNIENSEISHNEPLSIPALMTKLKTQIDNYLRRTKMNENGVSSSSGLTDDSDMEEQILFEDICNTADIIETIQKNASIKFGNSIPHGNLMSPTDNNNIEIIDLTMNPIVHNDYSKMLKNLQFDQYEIITQDDNGVLRFNIPYHFQNLALKEMVTVPSRMKRLAMEMSSLSSSLPISNESAIFVRHDESRIDVMKALITGPAGTPYMNGCFEFDIFCPANYPNSPILVNFQTTGRGTVRFNPNLYNSGKVCLSLLNTWQGENWNPKTSSILQVLVSIQGMILIPDPYFNEPGWEASRGTNQGQSASKAYNDNLLPSTIRHAMINQISFPSACFKKIIHTHFWLKKEEIKSQVTEWIQQSEGTSKQTLQAAATQLFNDLDKLTLPE